MSSRDAMRRLPLITAHTGCEGSPVNTVASMLQGARSGADAVEIDVRSTKDGAVILMHDDFILTRARGRILLQTLTLEELLTLEKNGEILCDNPKMRITRLEEALDAARGIGPILNLDLKDDRSITVLCETVRKYDLLDRAIVSGCDGARAVKVKRDCPDIQVLLNVSERQTAVKEICRQAVSACCCGLNIDYSLCSQQLVDYARLRHLPVSVWTVDRVADMQLMIIMGVYSITTYEPARLRRVKGTQSLAAGR